MNQNSSLLASSENDYFKNFLEFTTQTIKKEHYVPTENFNNMLKNFNFSYENNEETNILELNSINDIKHKSNETVLIEKAIRKYSLYLEEKSKLQLKDIYKHIPNMFNIVYNLSLKNNYLFLPLNHQFINIFLSKFCYKKLNDLKKENKNEKFFKTIPNLFYDQDITKNETNNTFLSWLGTSKFKYSEIYNQIFNSSDNFTNTLEEKYSYSIKFETDYLKSPFDNTKVEKIEEKVLKLIEKNKKFQLLFFKKKKKSKELLKLIIQENMLDFISKNQFVEGFIGNSDFYNNQEKLRKELANTKITRTLYEEYSNQKYQTSQSLGNMNSRNIIEHEYNNIIRNAVATSIINYYQELFLYYQISYYGLYDDMNKDKIKQFYIENINKNLRYIEDSNIKNKIRKKLDTSNIVKDLNLIINLYKETIENLKNIEKVFSLNNEDAFLLKFREFFKVIENKDLKLIYESISDNKLENKDLEKEEKKTEIMNKYQNEMEIN